MFAFCFKRFAEIKDCFSLVSTIIGVFGFGHLISVDIVFVLENIFSICFFMVFVGLEFFFNLVDGGVHSFFFVVCCVMISLVSGIFCDEYF